MLRFGRRPGVWLPLGMLLVGVASRRLCAEDLYVPKAEDFRPRYEADRANQARQSWADYWGWVQTFYKGNFFQAGWTSRCEGLLQGIRSEETRKQLRSQLNRVGMEVAGEWAKDNGVRKIDTAKITDFGQRLEAARKKDGGSGRILLNEIESIQKETAKALKKR